MRKYGFGREVDLVEKNKCPLCKKDINLEDFKDDLSKREFEISGMCQKCQDDIFKDEDEEETIKCPVCGADKDPNGFCKTCNDWKMD